MTSAAGPEANPEPSPRSTDRLEFIRQRRRSLAAKRKLLLLVPGYGGMVAVRYRSLPREEIGEWVMKLVNRDPSINDNIDLLVRCCAEILVRQDENSEWEPFDLDQDGPTTFSTGNLAEKLGESASTAREEVRILFSPDGSQPMAPESHSEPLLAWQQDVDFQVDRSLLGE